MLEYTITAYDDDKNIILTTKASATHAETLARGISRMAIVKATYLLVTENGTAVTETQYQRGTAITCWYLSLGYVS